MSYSLWMLEYAHSLEQAVGSAFAGAWNGGTMVFPFSYVYIEGEGHRILVDVGHDDRGTNASHSTSDKVTGWRPPDGILAKVGITPDQIDTVILTHAHYDHAGGARYFPNATFYLQRTELVSSRWALDNRDLYSSLLGPLDPADVEMLEGMAEEGALVLLDGPTEDLLPGIAIRTASDGHTMGSQYVVIGDEFGHNWVVTGDSMYSYRNFEGIDGSGTPVNIGFSTGSGWRGLQIIDEMARTAGTADRLVIVHEGETFSRYPSRTYPDELRVAELLLAPGEPSRIVAG